MSFNRNSAESLAALREHLRSAQMSTPQAVADVLTETYLLVHSQRSAAKPRVSGLLESGALVDAALALLELEFPQWKLRRLIYDNGDWHCSLSRRLRMPLELDDMAEARHPVLPLAMVCAVLEAHRINLAVREASRKSVPQVPLAQSQAICCDNFR